jgi:hypothetical protein
VPLPACFPRHTHIDIDARNAIYTNHFFGRGEAKGNIERVMTLSEFDSEVKSAFKKETFHLKRLEGLLDFKSLWNKWLSYEQYGTTRINSSQAAKQGGRAQEPMCLHFFLGSTEFPGKVLMKYKYRESDPHFMPYDHEGIPVLSDDAPDGAGLLVEPTIVGPKAWPEKDTVEKYLTTHKDMTPAQRQEWQIFFDNLPDTARDIPDEKRFKWLLPKLAKAFQEKRNGPTEGQRVGESERPEKPDERVIWAQYTRADYNRDQKQREANYARERHAFSERVRSEQLAAQESRSSGSEHLADTGIGITNDLMVHTSDGEDDTSQFTGSSSCDISSGADDDPFPKQPGTHSKSSISITSEKHKQSSNRKRRAPASALASKKKTASSISLGENGIVEVGDVVLFNPDSTSQAVDRANGYTLGMCMGKVQEINSKTKMVLLWWLFGSDWNHRAKWKFWRSPVTSNKYIDWVHAESLLITSFGTLAKISLIAKKRETFSIDRASVDIIHDVISTND